MFSLTNCRNNSLGVSAWKSTTKQAVPIGRLLRCRWWQKVIIEINQLPVYSTRWQHVYCICFATFIYLKNHKITNDSATDDAIEKNKHRVGIHWILEIVVLYLTQFKSTQILFDKISHQFLVTVTVYWVKLTHWKFLKSYTLTTCFKMTTLNGMSQIVQ